MSDPFKDDPEGRSIACKYAGSSFDQPKVCLREVFSEYGPEEWSLDEFKTMIQEAEDKIPKEFRSTAHVTLGYDFDEGPSRLKISYEALETSEEVAQRVTDCVKYVTQFRAKEVSTYERLKKKYGS